MTTTPDTFWLERIILRKLQDEQPAVVPPAVPQPTPSRFVPEPRTPCVWDGDGKTTKMCGRCYDCKEFRR